MALDSAVSDLEQLHRQARTARARLEPVWYLNLAYYMGEQWVAWDGRQLYRPSMPKNRITVVDNRVQPCVRTEIARMSKQRPTFVVTPQSPDEEDQNAAVLGEHIMRYLWKHLNMQELTQKALLWSRICGAGFIKTFWDSTIGPGRDVLVGPSGNVLTDAQGKVLDPAALPAMEGVQRQRVAQGDVRVEVRSPFQMFIDPLADTFPEAEWVIEESVKSREYVRRRYGVDMQPDTPANPGLIEARMGAVFMPGTGGYKGLKIKEYWCKPCATYPRGRRVVWVTTGGGADDRKKNGAILFEDDHPFDPMPYVMLTGIQVPGRLWPTSVVEQLRGPQTELNKVKSQIAENRNRVGNPTILASKQAVQDPDKFIQSASQAGGVYFYDDVGSPNAKPDYLAAPPLPDYVVEEIQRIEESIQEISGQHEVTSAQVPPGVTAASAINLLQEADDTRLGPAMADYEYQLGRAGQKLLKLVAKNYSDSRTIQLGGDNGAWQIFDFRGALLRGNTHVEVQAGSMFPQSKAAKQAWIQDLLNFFVQSGNPPQGRVLAQFLQDSQIGGAERLVQQYTADETQCNRENALMAAGQIIPVNEYDDDQAHIANHTDFQKQPRYGSLPPDARQNFEMHVEAHRQRAAAAQQAQVQLAQQLQGQGTPEQQQQQQQMQQQQQQQDMAQQQQQGQLEQAQTMQQLQMKDAQGAQQQGMAQAQSEQQQRQTEETHSQRLRHEEEQHQLALRQQAEQHAQQKKQADDKRQQQAKDAEEKRKQAKQAAQLKRRTDGQS